MLRRIKKDLLHELPPKTEIDQYANLVPKQVLRRRCGGVVVAVAVIVVAAAIAPAVVVVISSLQCPQTISIL